jgi:hypothetical protein
MNNGLITDGGKTGLWGLGGTNDFVTLPKVDPTFFYSYLYFL